MQNNRKKRPVSTHIQALTDSLAGHGGISGLVPGAPDRSDSTHTLSSNSSASSSSSSSSASTLTQDNTLTAITTAVTTAAERYYRRCADSSTEKRYINDKEVSEPYFGLLSWFLHRDEGKLRAGILLAQIAGNDAVPSAVKGIEGWRDQLQPVGVNATILALRRFFSTHDPAFEPYSYTAYLLDAFIDMLLPTQSASSNSPPNPALTKRVKYDLACAFAIIEALETAFRARLHVAPASSPTAPTSSSSSSSSNSSSSSSSRVSGTPSYAPSPNDSQLEEKVLSETAKLHTSATLPTIVVTPSPWRGSRPRSGPGHSSALFQSEPLGPGASGHSSSESLIDDGASGSIDGVPVEISSTKTIPGQG